MIFVFIAAAVLLIVLMMDGVLSVGLFLFSTLGIACVVLSLRKEPKAREIQLVKLRKDTGGKTRRIVTYR